MPVQTAPANGITIAYETFGTPGDPPLLLVMGLATQMLGWREEFCAELAAEGFLVIRFDNRDIGLSTHLDGRRAPTCAGCSRARRPRPTPSTTWPTTLAACSTRSGSTAPTSSGRRWAG